MKLVEKLRKEKAELKKKIEATEKQVGVRDNMIASLTNEKHSLEEELFQRQTLVGRLTGALRGIKAILDEDCSELIAYPVEAEED